MDLLIQLAYLLAAVGFILGLKLMGDPAKAKTGNYIAALGMLIAIVATAVLITSNSPKTVNIIFLISGLTVGTIIGRLMAYKVEMTGMPQLVSLFNALGGASAVVISINEVIINSELTTLTALVLALGAILGAISFSGSLVAYFKLDNKLKFGNQNLMLGLSRALLVVLIAGSTAFFLMPNIGLSFMSFLLIISFASLVYGITFTLPIGGADMPVLVSFLNAITGIATAFSGIAFDSPIMLVGGILVGATGIFLTVQMCTAMNRSLATVLAGKMKKGGFTQDNDQGEIEVQPITSIETASVLAFSKKIAIIPGYGMAVAQAQQACFELQKNLMNKGAEVTYIIHPVAGRMPGHMNVLLAEANVPYDEVFELEEINSEFSNTDAAFVIGANDITNPAAKTDKSSPIYGMPILDVENSGTVLFVKRS
ncbi:MAG: NAD(P)(+) transhydrogenase (Re/Si-specific) subunit beta, partial [Flavobacteriales bacterium]